MVCLDRTIFGRENLESEGAKNLNIENIALKSCPFMFAIVLHSITKINILYIYAWKLTKYLHGT